VKKFWTLLCGIALVWASNLNAQAPAALPVANATIPTRVLSQSPAETVTELQIICLFRSEASNGLHGALTETNEKLNGLLDKLRKPELFAGDLGETILIVPAPGTLTAKKLLIIGLGDSQTFTPERMEIVGAIAYREANRLGVAHPYFAPTVIDGGVTKFTTGDVALHFMRGFLRASATEKQLAEAGASAEATVQDLTYLAGVKYAAITHDGLERAFVENGGKPSQQK
jgi:hypothetical protein